MAAREKMTRETAIKKLGQLATAPVNDAVKLAFLESGEGIDGLDLSSLAEFRRTDKGGVEVKLIDRAAILRELAVLTDQHTEEKAAAFFKALEE